jgi:hypothetical protein
MADMLFEQFGIYPRSDPKHEFLPFALGLHRLGRELSDARHKGNPGGNDKMWPRIKDEPRLAAETDAPSDRVGKKKVM